MKKVVEWASAAAGVVISFFAGLPPIVSVLLAVMTLDYLTGILCAIMGRSSKTETGHLSSSVAFTGLLKKALIILVVLLAALLDHAVSMSANIQFEAVAGATCLWFIASEGMSILENAAKLGIPIPKIILDALELLRSKGNGKANVPTNTSTAQPQDQQPPDQQSAP